MPEGTVVRARLIALLDEAVTSSRVTLVCAPAGSGKSVLLSSWVELGAPPGPVVWVAVERTGTSTTPFWRRVADGLQAALGTPSDGASARTTDPERLGALARRLTRSSRPVVLVLDESGQAPHPALHRQLDRFVQQAGDALRLVFLTRADPVLPLHGYRLARALSEIRADDLRFTHDEAQELFMRSNVELTDDQVATMVERTNGWAAGLMFGCSFLGAKRDMDRAVRTFSGSRRAVSDFLVREVLAAQPENVREVLLRSSVADEMPVGLFEALTDSAGGHGVLAFLSRANTFIGPVPGKPHSYQYPPLFREFLRTRLAFEHPEAVAELHDIAAQWWFDNGFLPQAVDHAVAAGHWSDAAGFVVGGLGVGSILDDRLESVADRFMDMPASIQGAAAEIVRAALGVREGALSDATDALEAARSQLSEAGSTTAPDVNDAGVFSIELIEAVLAARGADLDGGLEIVRIAERHLTNLVGSPDIHPELKALLAGCRAHLQMWSGDVHGARASLTEAAGSARTAQWNAGEIAFLAQGALLTAAVGDLGEGMLMVDRARDLEESAPVGDTARALTSLASAWVMTEQCLTGPARGQLARADEFGNRLESVERALREVVRARLQHSKGDYVGARRTLGKVSTSLSKDALPEWLISWVTLAEQVHTMAEGSTEPGDGEPDAALLTLPGWQGKLPLGVQVTHGLMEAEAHLRADDESAAVSALDRALRLAARQRFRRPFTQVPPAVRDLLRRRDDLQAAHRWLTAADPAGRPRPEGTVQAFPRQRSATGGGGEAIVGGKLRSLVVEELTAKELEVLEHLAELHTTDEIAAGMFISVNTVRTHVRNILRKLGVDRRNEAVRRAWELELLSTPERGMEDGS